MKDILKIQQISLIALFLLNISYIAYAQEGYSSASITNQREKAGYGYVPLPEEVIVEEYMNYHRHKITLPKKDENVALSLDWGNNILQSTEQEAVLQIGIATNGLEDLQDMPPLNLCLVVDNSGSMSGEKIQKVKEGLLELIKKLRTKDVVSLVVFNSDATVILQATNANKIQNLEFKINQIEAGGGTNLEAGLILAYEEIFKYYDKTKTNRIIILTDGDANIGEINPQNLSKDPSTYNYFKNINLSAIGVGIEYNSGLLRTLIESADGQIHFIANDADIKKVFVNEVGSLLYPIGRNPELKITFDEALTVSQFFGYEPKKSSKKIKLDLEDFNSELTQVFLTRFQLDLVERSNQQEFFVKVELSYDDIQKGKRLIKTETTYLKLNQNKLNQANFIAETPDKEYIISYAAQKNAPKKASIFQNSEVKKNYAIAYMAQALKDMAASYEKGDKVLAREILLFCMNEINRVYPSKKDKDIKRLFDILESYSQNI